MSLTASAGLPQPSLAWQFESSNVDSVTGLAPFFSTINGALTSAPTYVTGKYGKAVQFNNTGVAYVSNSYVRYNVSIPIASFSICAWINPYQLLGTTQGQIAISVFDGSSNYFNLFGVNANQNNIYLFGQNPWTPQPVNITINGSGTMPTNTWTHLAATFNNGTIAYYLNGALQGTTTFANTFTVTQIFAGAYWNTGNGFNGSIDDLRIFNKALTATQVQAVYKAQGILNRGIFTTQIPSVSGYTYVPFSALPASFTLVQTSTGNAWTINTGSNQIRDGTWGGDPVLTMVPSQPGDIYSARNPGIWYRLFGNSNYVRHFQFVMLTNGYAPGSFDFAWAFFLQNGTTNQIKIWNPFPGDGVGYWVQSGLQTAGRIAISTQNPALASVYTISSPVSSTSLSGTPLFSQLSTSATASAVGAFSLRAVNGTSPSGTAKAVQVRRSSDSATQDFYADRLGNLLTAPVTGQTLASWLGSATGNVTTWYDQSGSNNFVQTATSKQPRIVLNSGKWTLFFNRDATPTFYSNLGCVNNITGVQSIIYNFNVSSTFNSYQTFLGQNLNDNGGFRLDNNLITGDSNNRDFLTGTGSYWYLNNAYAARPATTNSSYTDNVWNYVIGVCPSNSSAPWNTFAFNSISSPATNLTARTVYGYLSEMLIFSSQIGATDANTLYTTRYF